MLGKNQTNNMSFFDKLEPPSISRTKDVGARLAKASKPVAFSKTIGLLGATNIGVGSLMGAGLYVLIGVAAGAAGPALILAYGICGLLTLLTVATYADLSRRLPSSGGGYLYAYDQLGPFWGFVVGWHLAAGSIFACALYALGFASYFLALLPLDHFGQWVPPFAATAIVALLGVVASRGGRGAEGVQRVFTWGNLLVLLLLCGIAALSQSADHFTPFAPAGMSGVGAAVSLIYISFFGFQLIANSAEEIHDAPRTVPRAMLLSFAIALVFYLAVSALAVGAVGAPALAGSSAPFVLVASAGLGRAAGIVIGAGGVLASVAALNGTLISQARQLYAMGRDRLLPERLGRLQEKSGVPTVALVLGCTATALTVWLGELSFIAKAANFSLLFSMLPVSIALARIQRVAVTSGEQLPLWRKVVPYATLAANGAMLLTLDPTSLFFGGTIVAACCLVFIGYSQSSEKRGAAGLSVSLSGLRSGFDVDKLRLTRRVIVPMSNPASQPALLAAAEALLTEKNREIVVLSVVVSSDPRQALRSTQASADAVEIISRAEKLADTNHLTIRSVVRAAKSLARGLADAIEEERADLLVMGWSAAESGGTSPLVSSVLKEARCDAVFLHLRGPTAMKRIGVALGSTSNLPLMVRLAAGLAEHWVGSATYLSIVPEYFDEAALRHARKVHVEAIERHTRLAPYTAEVLRSSNPAQALIEASSRFDLLVIGSASGESFESDRIGSFSAMIVEQSSCSVAVVRQAQLIHKMRAPAQVALFDLWRRGR